MPVGVAFATLTDFDHLVKEAVRRGAEVRRVDTLEQAGVGQAWTAAFLLRDRKRQVSLEVVGYQPEQSLELSFTSDGLQGAMHLEFSPLSAARTQVVAGLEMHAVTLSGRLLLQSLKLARPHLTERYAQRVAQLVQEIERRHSGAS